MSKKKQTAHDWSKDKGYLPDFMKDFHDQKDLFKSMEILFEKNENFKKLPGSWIDRHIYVIDFFLWFMGQNGYTLQKNRSNVEFFDIQDTIKHYIAIHQERSFKVLSGCIKTPINETTKDNH